MEVALLRLFRRPYLVACIGMLWGYVGAKLAGVPRAAEPDLVRYIRRQQLNRLLGRGSIWR